MATSIITDLDTSQEQHAVGRVKLDGKVENQAVSKMLAKSQKNLDKVGYGLPCLAI